MRLGSSLGKRGRGGGAINATLRVEDGKACSCVSQFGKNMEILLATFQGEGGGGLLMLRFLSKMVDHALVLANLAIICKYYWQHFRGRGRGSEAL